MAVGFVCMKLEYNSIYSYEHKTEDNSFSDRTKTESYTQCIRKNEYIEEQYFYAEKIMSFFQEILILALLIYQRITAITNLKLNKLSMDYSHM